MIKKAYKFRLKPSAAQAALLHSYAGHTRFIWNKALQLNLARLKSKQRIMYYQELDFWSKLWKKSDEYGFLKECPAHIIQQKLRDLEKAFRDGFDKKQPNKKMPRYKKRGVRDSFRFPEPKHVNLEHNYITLPKVGRMKFYRSCSIKGKIKNFTVSRRGPHWYISVQVEAELPATITTKPIKEIGLDVGIKHFVSTSEGEQIAPINSYRGLADKLAIAQRKLSKQTKFSSNWKKQQNRIRKIHIKIADTRNDFLHKLTTDISKSHAVIIVEDLKIKNMSKSAKGTNAAPGKNVRAKSGLNKSILDQGWYEFRRQLEYKTYWRGGRLIEVAPHYTSQECSSCHHVSAQNRQTQEKFACCKCHFEDNADINAAKNILAAGRAVMACGASAQARL